MHLQLRITICEDRVGTRVDEEKKKECDGKVGNIEPGGKRKAIGANRQQGFSSGTIVESRPLLLA